MRRPPLYAAMTAAATIAAIAFALGWLASSQYAARSGPDTARSAAAGDAPASAAPSARSGAPEQNSTAGGAALAPPNERTAEPPSDALTRSALLAALNCADSAPPAAARACLGGLARFPLSDPQIREAFLGYLAATRDPSRREQVIAAMTPTPLPADQLAPLLAQIQTLRSAEEPRLRAASLVHLAQWDRSAAIDRPLREGLDDADPEVVRAAMTAVSVSNARSEELKQTLLLLASESPPGSELRDAAVEALRDFSFDAREYAIYRDAAASARAP